VFVGFWLFVGLMAIGAQSGAPAPVETAADAVGTVRWWDVFTPGIIVTTLVLVCLSAFFSASEIAFFSLHKLQLRSMNEEAGFGGALVYRLMKHPGNLLTTILMCNSIVNVLLSVVFAPPVERYFAEVVLLPATASYPIAMLVTTGFLVFFGEIFPKVFVVRASESYARVAVFPIFIVDRLMRPLRNLLIGLTGLLFKFTRFSEMTPAPFITDEEFVSLLTEGEASGVIEQEERRMIQSIIEFGDDMVREILVPRPDMLVVKADATVAEALDLIKEKQYSRIPIVGENIDEIVGILYAKDLLHLAEEGEVDQTVGELGRPPHYVPETMTVSEFVKTAQKTRTHLAIVVDEFGGTEGLVTLEDALREVVGAIEEEEHVEPHSMVQTGDHEYEVDGGYPLDDLEELTGLRLDTPVHMTVAGFMIEQQDRLPEQDDTLDHEGVNFRVLEMDGRRVARMRITITEDALQRMVATEEAANP